jgi:hypothetical protein
MSLGVIVGVGVALPPGARAYLTDALSHAPNSYNSFRPNTTGFPEAGGTYVDADFNETIRRLTDETAINPRTAGSDIYGRNGFYNANGTRMLHRTGDDRLTIINTDTGAAVCPNILDIAWPPDSSFDPVDSNVWYFFRNNGANAEVRSFNVSTCQENATAVKVFTNARLDNLGGSVDWIDNSGQYMLFNLNGILRVWNKTTNVLYTNGIAFNQAGGGWAGISPDGSYVIISDDSVEGHENRSWVIDHVNRRLDLASEKLFWTLTGGHADLVTASDGKTYYVATDSTVTGDIYRVDVTKDQSHTDQQKQLDDNEMIVDLDNPEGGPWLDTDGHFSAVSKGTLQNWVYVSVESLDDPFNSGTSVWRRYKQEIFMVNVITKEIRRLAHHRSRGLGGNVYNRQPRVSASWNGGRVAWASNFNISTPSDYADIYLITVTVPPGTDTTQPNVSITAPLNSETVSGTRTVTATATDNVGVVGVQFKRNGQNLGAEDTTGPYSTSWNTLLVANGTHTLTAVARDAAGNVRTSAAVSVIVNNPDTTLPTVSITAPANGATVSGTQLVSAIANDNNAVVGVQFKLDGANLGAEDTASPYSVTWNTAQTTLGAHTLTAVARDAAGNVRTSAPVSVTVTTGGTDPEPVIWINAVNVTVTGNSLLKTGGCDCDNAGAVSQQTIPSGDGYVEVTVSGTTLDRWIGLSKGNPGTTTGEIDFALELAAGFAQVFESDSYRADTSIVNGDVLRIAVEGGVVKYRKNGALFYTSLVAPAYPLLVDTALLDMSSRIDNAIIARTSGSGGGTGLQAVVWASTVNVTATGNSLQKTGGCDCDNAGAVSQQTIASGNGYMEVTVSGTTLDRWIGLSKGNPGTTTGEIDFALELAAGYAQVFESNTYRADTPIVNGDVLRIGVEGGVVKYRKNGTLFYTSLVAPAYPLLVDTAMLDMQSTVNNVMIFVP